MKFEVARQITFRLYGLALVLQGIEGLWVSRSAGAGAVFNLLQSLPTSNPSGIWKKFLHDWFSRRGLNTVLMFNLIFGWMILFGNTQPGIVIGAFGSAAVFSIFHFGAFNGGSDAMTRVVSVGAVALSVGNSSGWIAKAGFLWIAIQSVLSYFLSGVRKARNPLWWNGRALLEFVSGSRVTLPVLKSLVMQSHSLLVLGSWGVLLFELGFPLGLFWEPTRSAMLILGAGFHLLNFFCFGLNRFFWIWMATYPAIWIVVSGL